MLAPSAFLAADGRDQAVDGGAEVPAVLELADAVEVAGFGGYAVVAVDGDRGVDGDPDHPGSGGDVLGVGGEGLAPAQRDRGVGFGGGLHETLEGAESGDQLGR